LEKKKIISFKIITTKTMSLNMNEQKNKKEKVDTRELLCNEEREELENVLAF
jgi:hypothetical protein